MACVTWAEAWQFASFWCVEQLLSGVHGGAGPADVALSDAQAQFQTKGAQANVGMVLYNLTAGTSGQVTAVTETTLRATGVTWDPADIYRIVLITGLQIATIDHWLDVAANDIHAVLASVGACDCTLASWANGYLEKLNIIDAILWYNCPCGNPHITDSMKQAFLNWMSTQLSNISTGVIDVCQGATGAGFPAIGWASQSVSEFAAAEIIYNDILRNS